MVREYSMSSLTQERNPLNPLEGVSIQRRYALQCVVSHWNLGPAADRWGPVSDFQPQLQHSTRTV